MHQKYITLFLLLQIAGTSLSAQFPRFKALAFYSEEVEPAHVEFAHDAIHFFKDLTIGDGFIFDTTSNMDDLNANKLEDYSVIIMLNDLYEYGAWKPNLHRSNSK